MKDLAIDALAAYRLTRLIHEDSITYPLRDKLISKSDSSHAHDFFAELVSCPYCVSMHAGAAAAALALLSEKSPLARFAKNALALSGAVSIYYEYRNSRDV